MAMNVSKFKYLFIIFVFLFDSNAGKCSADEFELKPLQDILILGGGYGLNRVADRLIADITPPYAWQLDEMNINPLERWAVRDSNRGFSILSDVTALLAALGNVGVGIYGDGETFTAGRIFTDAVMFVESNEIAYSLTRLIKGYSLRPRPYAYRADPSTRLRRHAMLSFWSFHAADAFSNAVHAGYVYQKRNPDSRYVNAVWATGLSLATVTAVSRVMAGEHFPSDVIAGAAVGSFIGWLIPRIHLADPTNENGNSPKMLYFRKAF